MAPVVPNPKKIRAFKSETAFEAWLRAHHAREAELWLRIYKKGSGRPTVTNAQALDVALCWGWIDGLRKALDEESFLQRYTPRRARSMWSQINRGHVKRLTAAGRMKPPGQRQIDAAKVDGRWDAAYAPIRAATTATIPDDLRRRERPPTADGRATRPGSGVQCGRAEVRGQFPRGQGLLVRSYDVSPTASASSSSRAPPTSTPPRRSPSS